MNYKITANEFNLIVIGGGPAGFMGAITAAEKGVGSVLILEKLNSSLEKVRISGGGRCNVTHDCWDPKDLVTNYPRGRYELLSPFHRFSTIEAIDWFKERGLDLLVEPDGRMFPSTNSSSDVIACLKKSASLAGVIQLNHSQVVSINTREDDKFSCDLSDGTIYKAKRILLATGNSPVGMKIAKKFGHTIIEPVPSLFSLVLNDSFLSSSSGIAVDDVNVKLLSNNRVFQKKGRILITHKGLSGPVILKLSAFAARDLYIDNYKCILKINWAGLNRSEVEDVYVVSKNKYRSKPIGQFSPYKNIPKRLWNCFLLLSGINSRYNFSNITKIQEMKLIDIISNHKLQVKSKGPFGEEFVKAGGISLKEVDFKTMESLKKKGLFLAGEILDIDGVTGGFNFQQCWTTGWISGLSIYDSLQ